METVVIVAVSILAVLLVGCFVGVVAICYQRYYNKRRTTESDDENSINQNVLAFDENDLEANTSSLELESVVTCDDGTIRQLLETEEWANDVQGIIPHCIGILKMCREVTVKLVAVTMENNHQNVHPSRLTEIVVVAKCITPRVDDVMRAIAPPIDIKQLEARSAALIYSVQHLALLIRNAWQSYHSLDWIDAVMDNMAQHMKILRSASEQQENPSVHIVNGQMNDNTQQQNEPSTTSTNKVSSQL